MHGRFFLILMLGSSGANTQIVYNYLADRFGRFPVLIESPPSRLRMIKRRAERVGVGVALSQAVFISLFQPALRMIYRRRIDEICEEHALDRSPIPGEFVTHVSSVNDEAARRKIASLDPEVVVVNGTRIISRQTLSVIDSPFINTHAGITPRYRGVHGGYWALYHGDRDRCGVTVHLIDPGIDTGRVISQALINPSKSDGFPTYPYLQLAAALPLLGEAVENALEGRMEARTVADESNLWYHPTVGQYLTGHSRGVR